MESIKNFLTKKKIVAIAAVSVAVVAIVGFTGKGRREQSGNMIMPNGTRTTVLQSTTLSDSVTVTGTVESTESVNVTTTVDNAKVAEILVQVGDKVSEGDVVMKLETDTIQEKIDEVKEKLTDSAEKAQEEYTKAENALADALDDAEDAEDGLDDARDARDEADKNFDIAKAAVVNEQNAYDRAVEKETAANNALNKAITEKNEKDAETLAVQAEYDKAQKKYDELNASAEATEEEKTVADDELKAASEKLAAAQEKQKAAADKAAAAQTDYDSAKQNAKDALAQLDSIKATTNYNNLKRTYEAAKQAYETARKNLDSLESAYEKARDSFETAKENLENANTSDELEELYEKYNDCIITAETGGTITRINTAVGSVANGTLAVIQDTDHLKISTSFRESDVQDIAIGMKCVITSDANDKELSGYVSQISPTAASGGMGGSSDVSFTAEITIDGTDHGLLIGMNAKAEVILSQKDDVFVVPYDAVGTDENGEKIVYVQEGEEFNPVAVTTGMETDYYIEISSPQLSAGMVIRSSANEDESESVGFTEEGEEAKGGFAMGGMTGTMPAGGMGGGMPSGNGRPGVMPGGRG